MLVLSAGSSSPYTLMKALPPGSSSLTSSAASAFTPPFSPVPSVGNNMKPVHIYYDSICFSIFVPLPMSSQRDADP